MKQRVGGTSPLSVLGDTVRSRRRELGLSQEALAERSNLHLNFVGRLERGQIVSPELISLLKLSIGLEVEPAYLLQAFTPDVMKKMKSLLLKETPNPHQYVGHPSVTAKKNR